MQSALVCYFEDSVGPQGRDRFRQECCVKQKQIAEHIGCSLSDEEICSVADHLFGGTATFRKAKN